MTGFDWTALLRGAFALGLKPAEFWALTPAEFRLLAGPRQGARPMGRSRLSELAAAFPDNIREERDG